MLLLRSEIIEHINQSIVEIEQERNGMQRDAENHQIKLNDLQQTSLKLQELVGTVDETASISVVKEELAKKEKVYSDYEDKKDGT